MRLLEKILGKKKNQLDKVEHCNKETMQPPKDAFWDTDLEKISYQEEIRYKIYKHFGELKHGDSITQEDVFGKEGVSIDEHFEFLGAIIKLSNPFPTYKSHEELKEAEACLENADGQDMVKIANTYLMNSDFANANRWYLRAANLGDGEALCRLAGAYKHGCGVQQDLYKAIQLYKQAIIADGKRDALLDLGLCYLRGEGVPQNIERGLFLMERSARQGNMQAQYNMGFLYRTGTGVEANLMEALHWYRLSAAQGYEQAIEFLNHYEKEEENK